MLNNNHRATSTSMQSLWAALHMCLIQSHFKIKHHCITYHGICSAYNQPCGEHHYMGPIKVFRTYYLSTSENEQVFALSQLHSASRNINPMEITHCNRVECSLYSVYYDTECTSHMTVIAKKEQLTDLLTHYKSFRDYQIEIQALLKSMSIKSSRHAI